MIVHESWWNPIARFADIVFPAATALERNDVAAGWADSWISAMHRAVEPPGEVRTDYETLCALAERLGVLDAFSEGRDGDEWVRHFYDDDAGEPGREGRGATGLRGVLGGRPDRVADAAAPARARLRGPARESRGRAAAHALGPHRARLGHDRELRLRRLPGPPGLDGARRMARVGSRSPLPAAPHLQPAVDAAALPVRQRQLQPGLEGRAAASRSGCTPTTPTRAGSPTATSCACSTTAAPVSRERCSTPTSGARSCSSRRVPGGIPSRRAIRARWIAMATPTC